MQTHKNINKKLECCRYYVIAQIQTAFCVRQTLRSLTNKSYTVLYETLILPVLKCDVSPAQPLNGLSTNNYSGPYLYDCFFRFCPSFLRSLHLFRS
jgi:hypothetical protein